jgi:anti-anti-sigma regulatory factor
MNHRPYISLLFILAITIFFITVYAFVNYQISIGKYIIKKSDIAQLAESIATQKKNKTQKANTAPKEIDSTNSQKQKHDSLKTKLTTDVAQATMDTTSQRILLVGDSMGQSVFFALQKYCKNNGHQLFLEAVESSTLVWWSKNDTLAKLIEKYDPTYIIISLGSNELFVPKIEKRKPHLENILAQIGDIPFIWIAPPNWKEDTGINEMLVNTIGEKKVFFSKDLKMERMKDGAHPTWKAAFYWVDTISSWIMNKSQYPILLKKTKKNAPPKPNTRFVIKKNIDSVATAHPKILKEG